MRKLERVKNTIGMSLITLDQHDMAEEYLISALSILEDEKGIESSPNSSL